MAEKIKEYIEKQGEDYKVIKEILKEQFGIKIRANQKLTEDLKQTIDLIIAALKTPQTQEEEVKESPQKETYQEEKEQEMPTEAKEEKTQQTAEEEKRKQELLEVLRKSQEALLEKLKSEEEEEEEEERRYLLAEPYEVLDEEKIA